MLSYTTLTEAAAKLHRGYRGYTFLAPNTPEYYGALVIKHLHYTNVKLCSVLEMPPMALKVVVCGKPIHIVFTRHLPSDKIYAYKKDFL